MRTSSNTWGGRTSSCSIVSWSTEKLGGAVRITSEFVAWSGTMVVPPTRPPAEAGLAAGLYVELAQQVEIARDAHTAVRDEHRIGARHDLDACRLARHLLQERHGFVGTHVLERDDLRHEPERRRCGELLADPHGTGGRALLLRQHLRHGAGLHQDQALALEDGLEHRSHLRGGH